MYTYTYAYTEEEEKKRSKETGDVHMKTYHTNYIKTEAKNSEGKTCTHKSNRLRLLIRVLF